MKKITVFTVLVLILLIGCKMKKEEENKVGESITYSNLVDDESQMELKKYLENAGIDIEKIESFLNDVNDFNKTVGNVSLVEKGYKTANVEEIEYDEITMLEKWESKYPDSHGHNCRITSFRLLEDFIKIKNPVIEDDGMLFFDKDTLRKQKNLLNKEDREFLSLFSYIPTEDTNKIDVHLKNLKENWKKKGIEFTNNKISVISVIFNTNIEEKSTTSQLFVGHIGLLFENKDKKLVFLEKLSFSTPYQMTIFDNRKKLKEYIMSMYDVDKNEKTAPPFIMENGELLKW